MDALFVDGPMDRTRQFIDADQYHIHFAALKDPFDTSAPHLVRESETHTYTYTGMETPAGTRIFVWDNPHRLRMAAVPE